jgi:hypothetical protein
VVTPKVSQKKKKKSDRRKTDKSIWMFCESNSEGDEILTPLNGTIGGKYLRRTETRKLKPDGYCLSHVYIHMILYFLMKTRMGFCWRLNHLFLLNYSHACLIIYLSVCLSVCLPVYLSIYIYIYLYLSIYLSIYLSASGWTWILSGSLQTESGNSEQSYRNQKDVY